MESSLILHQCKMAAQPLRRRTMVQAKKQDSSTPMSFELSENIGKRRTSAKGLLPSGRDSVNFRSMCKLWCASPSYTKFTPVLMLPFDRSLRTVPSPSTGRRTGRPSPKQFLPYTSSTIYIKQMLFTYCFVYFHVNRSILNISMCMSHNNNTFVLMCVLCIC